jgi:transposase InsO family protein
MRWRFSAMAQPRPRPREPSVHRILVLKKPNERLVWRMEFETLDELRAALAAHIEHSHRRPHSGLDYRTPAKVRQTRDEGAQPLQIQPA